MPFLKNQSGRISLIAPNDVAMALQNGYSIPTECEVKKHLGITCEAPKEEPKAQAPTRGRKPKAKTS